MFRLRGKAKGAAGQAVEKAAEPTGFIARYEPQGVLGVGPLGRVYVAIEKESGRKVAFRGFRRPKEANERHWQQAIERYTRELTEARKLDHPNIARIYEFGEEDGVYYVVSEWFDGEALQKKLDRGDKIDTEKALDIANQAGRALDYAAHMGVYHGDITPYNLILTREGGVRMVNFGLAHCRPKQDSPYRAPEELDGHEGDPRSDLFVLGLLLYQLLAGHHPFGSGASAEIHARVRQSGTPPVPGSDPHVQAAVDRLLAKDVTQRAQRWSQAASELVKRQTAAGRANVEEEMPWSQGVPAIPPPLAPRPAVAASLAEYRLSDSDVAAMRERLEERKREARAAVWGRFWLGVRYACILAVVAFVARTVMARKTEHAMVMGKVRGSVQVAGTKDGKLGKWTDAAPGQPLREMDTVRTGKNAGAVLVLGDGTRLRLGPDTTLGIRELRMRRTSLIRARTFYLSRGVIYARVRPRPNQKFSVITPAGTATAKGTEYTTKLQNGMEVSTLSGAVEAKNKAGSILVNRGQRGTLAPGQKPDAAGPLPATDLKDLESEFKELAAQASSSGFTSLLDSLGDLVVNPVVDLGGGVGDAARQIVTGEALKQGSAAARGQTAMQALVYALEMGGEEGYPETLDPKTLAEIGPTDEMREKILGQFKDRKLEYYKRVPGGYEVAARLMDTKGTLIIARTGKITIRQSD